MLKKTIIALGFLWCTCSQANNINIEVLEYKGAIYLIMPAKFVLIHSDVSIPLFIEPKNRYVKIQNTLLGWQAKVLSSEEWVKINPKAIVRNKIVSSYVTMNDSSVNIYLKSPYNGSVFVSGLSDTIRVTEKDVVQPKKLTFIHTDIMGSPIAESDVKGVVTQEDSYQPFGEKNRENK